MKKPVSIMYSGGLDSFIAYHYAIANGYNPICIMIDMGHPYAEKEFATLERIPEKYRPKVSKINMKELYPLIQERLNNQIIPSRNVMLATIGAMFSSEVWLGVLDGEQNGKEHDKSERFFDDTSKLLTFTNSYFQEVTLITSPFKNMSKSETIKWALDYGIPKEVLFLTSTCYSDEHQKCGTCLTCVKRYMSFLSNGIKEPGYHKNPLESDYYKELSIEIPKALFNKDFSRFTIKRCKEFQNIQKLISF